ncbi:MAG: hypothetical protein IJX80_06825 [Clostridia bacterium]|nr:hypothetical protein [Clostridia bacterium]
MILADFEAIRFDATDVESMVEEDEALGDDIGNDNAVTDNSYIADNNKIVLVLYGDRDEKTHEKTATKGFILNYNNYAVRVSYNGITYTVESGGYVVIENLVND